MMRILLSAAVVLFFCTRSFANIPPHHTPIDPKLQLLKQQVIKDILSAKANTSEAASMAASIKADGSWPDIDYADKTRGGWPVADHLSRLINMALAYKQPGTQYTGNAALEQKIMLALNFWLGHDLICPNWWYPQIGVPKILAPVMLLLEDSLNTAQIATGVKILERAKIGMTGQNKVWLSGNVIYRSLLTGDVPAVEAAVKAIQEEIVVSEGEGIQADWSFHQHGPQQQFGNYGSAYAGDMLKWAGIFQGTAFQFEANKIAILRNYLLQGMRWIIWKNNMDISACGRQLFPNAQAGKANSIQNIVNKMPAVDAAFSKEYANALADFSGNKHFWKSDMTVHRRNSFYASVKMSSRRVGGAESCNEENIQGYHLGDGATYFYQGNHEYTDIFPFWNWKMIPGTTAFHNEAPLPVLPCSGYNIPSDFVGGVSNGANGIATMAYRRDSLQAQKSWFFFDDMIICLGAGIQSAEDKEVRTTINQSFLQGDVMVKQGAQSQVLSAGEHNLSNTSWVLHDGWGYYFPGGAGVELSNRAQEGDWHRVLTRMPAETINANIFTLWFNHQRKPAGAGYTYIVLPAATPENIEKRGGACRITENTSARQVAECGNKQMTGLVFAQPGQASTLLAGKISADKPCVLLAEKKYAVLHISVAEPTHKETTLTIGLPGDKKCTGAAAVYDKLTNRTLITVSLPQGPDAGKTVELMVE